MPSIFSPTFVNLDSRFEPLRSVQAQPSRHTGAFLSSLPAPWKCHTRAAHCQAQSHSSTAEMQVPDCLAQPIYTFELRTEM